MDDIRCRLKKAAVTVLLLSGTLCACGCGLSDSDGGIVIPRKPKEKVEAEHVSIRLWIPKDEIAMTEQLVKNFDAVHEEYEISFEIEEKGIDDASQEIDDEDVEAGDIFYLPSGGVESMAEKGILLPIELGFEKLAVDLPESAVQAVTVGNTAYAVPFSPNSYFMYYNKDFFSEEEVKSLDTMMHKDLGKGVYNFSTEISNSWYLEMFFLGNGCTLFGEDGQDPGDCTFNGKNGLDAGNYVLELASNPKYLDNKDGAGMEAFQEGKVGAITTGAWSAPDFKEALGDKLGAVPLPTADMSGEAVTLSNFVDFKTIAANARTKYPEAVQQLVVYLANKDSSRRRFEAFGEIPVLQNLADNEAIKNDIAASALNAQVNFATSQPSISQMDNYWGNMAEFGTGILDGSIDQGNLKQKLDQLVENITKKNGDDEPLEE